LLHFTKFGALIFQFALLLSLLPLEDLFFGQIDIGYTSSMLSRVSSFFNEAAQKQAESLTLFILYIPHIRMSSSFSPEFLQNVIFVDRKTLPGSSVKEHLSITFRKIILLPDSPECPYKNRSYTDPHKKPQPYAFADSHKIQQQTYGQYTSAHYPEHFSAPFWHRP